MLTLEAKRKKNNTFYNGYHLLKTFCKNRLAAGEKPYIPSALTKKWQSKIFLNFA